MNSFLWKPNEIVKRMPGVSTRQIADMAEKGVIKPLVKADGPGTSRLYNQNGVFSFMVAQVVRRYLSQDDLRAVVKRIVGLRERNEMKNLCVFATRPDVLDIFFYDEMPEFSDCPFYLNYHCHHIFNLKEIDNHVKERFT